VEGGELVQARVDIDSGVTAPRHSHPARRIVCVIEGTFDVIRTAAAATEEEA
jgi:quercetin dioxygenase-like cupin family protein